VALAEGFVDQPTNDGLGSERPVVIAVQCLSRCKSGVLLRVSPVRA
jgi:hypothetical protein